MGIISSPIPEIDDLYFHQLPSGRPINIEKVVRIGNTLVMLGKNGKLYSNVVGKFAYSAGDWPWISNVMNALVRLGVITKEQMTQHMKYNDARIAKEDREYAKKSLQRIEKKYGIKFSKQQWGAILK